MKPRVNTALILAPRHAGLLLLCDQPYAKGYSSSSAVP
jgi:hypothetical protein